MDHGESLMYLMLVFCGKGFSVCLIDFSLQLMISAD